MAIYFFLNMRLKSKKIVNQRIELEVRVHKITDNQIKMVNLTFPDSAKLLDVPSVLIRDVAAPMHIIAHAVGMVPTDSDNLFQGGKFNARLKSKLQTRKGWKSVWPDIVV